MLAEYKESVFADPDSFCEMNMDMLKTHHEASWAHVMRVAAISEAAGKALGLNEEDMELLKWSAYLHDVGKLCVSSELLGIKTEPTEKQKRQMQDIHMDGTRGILNASNLSPDLKEKILKVVMWHHELYNLSDDMNYPRGRGGIDYSGRDRRETNQEPSILAKIIAFSDKLDRAINGYNNTDGDHPNLGNLEERMSKYMDLDNMTADERWIFDNVVEEGRMIFEYGDVQRDVYKQKAVVL